MLHTAACACQNHACHKNTTTHRFKKQQTGFMNMNTCSYKYALTWISSFIFAKIRELNFMSTKGEKKQNKGFGPVHEAMKIFIHI